jgi:hypothetical protein
MGDPVITPQLLAAAGAGIGALSKPRNPLQGALLGGIAGYTGGTALGLGAPTATTTAASAAAPVASVADTALANQIAANQAASYGGGNILAANAANTANLNAMNAAGLSFKGMAPGYKSVANVANTANAAPSFFEKIGMAGKNAYENTGQSLTALSATNSLLQPDQQMATAPVVPVTARGQLRPFDPVALLDPYKPSVIGNSQFSLI